MRALLIFIFCLIQLAIASKIGIFVLEVSNSQVLYNKRVADTLADAGHNVTLIMIQPFPPRAPEIKMGEKVKVHRVISHTGLDVETIEKEQASLVYKDLPIYDARTRKHMNMMSVQISKGCEMTIKNTEFLEWLKKEKFDIAFTHPYDFCPIGLIHYAEIPTWVWLNSGALMDFTADAVGVPLIPSYVPPMLMAAGSKMNFVERVKSFIGHGLMKVIYPRMFPTPQTELFRKYVDPQFPALWDLAKQCPLVMVNSNELYEFARPTLHKVVNIGGLGMQFKDAKPLTKEFQEIVDKSKGVVLMSFGSVAKIDLMPEQWKKDFMTAFSRFPDYQFILRYSSDDIEEIRPKNVHFSKWIPQNDLLKHEKTVAFISHGGYNSLQETLVSGKPIITIPLFGDQPKNAKIAEQIGFGVIVQKSTVNADSIEKVIREVIDNKKYAQVAQRISHMVQKKPIKPEELLVKWTEFLAEFKTLENLVPYGNNLNFIQYHSLDVIVFLTVTLTIILYAFWKMLRAIFFKFLRMCGLCKCTSKPKTD